MTEAHLDPSRPPSSGRAFLLTAALAAFVIFFRLGGPPVVHGDEALYVLNTVEMVQGGSPWFPSLDGEASFSKAPLTIWAMALSYRLFGMSEFSTRLFAALCAWGTVVALMGLVGQLFRDAKIAALAGLLLALNPTFLYVHCARHGEPDAPAMLFFTLSVWAFVTAARRDRGAALFWCGAAAGGAAMVKTLAVGVLPLAVVFLCLPLAGAWRTLGARRLWLVPVGFAVVVLPWHLAAVIEYGRGFLDSYLWEQTVSRIEGGAEVAGEERWQAIQILESFHPFGLLLVASPLVMILAGRGRRRADAVFLIWAAVVGLAVAGVQARLAWYILPAYPAFAALIAATLVRVYRMRTLAAAPLLLGSAVLAFLFVLPADLDPLAQNASRAARLLRLTVVDEAGGSPAFVAWLIGAAVLGAIDAVLRAPRHTRVGAGLRGTVVALLIAAMLLGLRPLQFAGQTTELARRIDALHQEVSPTATALFLGRTYPHLSLRASLVRRDGALENYLDRREDFLSASRRADVELLHVAGDVYPEVRDDLRPDWRVVAVLERAEGRVPPLEGMLVTLTRRSQADTVTRRLDSDAEDSRARRRALLLTGLLARDGAGATLLEALETEGRRVAADALVGLQLLGDESVRGPLRRWLRAEDRPQATEQLATAVLAVLGDERARERLRTSELPAPGEATADAVLRAAFRVDPDRTLQQLQEQLPDEEVARTAYRLAGKTAVFAALPGRIAAGDPLAVALLERPEGRLLTFTADEKQWTREQLEALASRRATDADTEVADLAAESLRHDHPRIWRSWVPTAQRAD